MSFSKSSFVCAGFAFLAVVAFCLVSGCAGSAANAPATEARGSITAADGTVLAQSSNVKDGKGVRNYPEGALTSAITSSVYVPGAPEGIEQRFESELSAGQDIQLTIDMNTQKVAAGALEGHTGAAVVLDPETGAVLAMATSPAFDPNEQSGEAAGGADALNNRAAKLYIPGSTFKTVTLAAALENGMTSLNELILAPEAIDFQDGQVVNYSSAYSALGGTPELTVCDAYAQSANTVFAQLVMRMDFSAIVEQARAFGFDSDLMGDFPLERSGVANAEDMTALQKAWSGVGQSVYDENKVLHGPQMTVVQGAVIAALVENGGQLPHPYIVVPANDGAASSQEGSALMAMSPETAAQIAEGMRLVVLNGTGAGADVPGVEVAGKTGTAETVDGSSDGWFIGFAKSQGKSYAFAVLVEGDEGAAAARVSSGLIQGLFT